MRVRNVQLGDVAAVNAGQGEHRKTAMRSVPKDIHSFARLVLMLFAKAAITILLNELMSTLRKNIAFVFMLPARLFLPRAECRPRRIAFIDFLGQHTL